MNKLSVIVPTYNESKNVRVLITLLVEHLEGTDWEVLVVDDNSPDKTYEVVNEISRTNHRVSCLRRLDDRGLSSACIVGFNATNGEYMAVMDGDLQHPVQALLPMLQIIEESKSDIILGSRYKGGNISAEWPLFRRFISKFATIMALVMLGKNKVSDPMSGYFILKRSTYLELEKFLSGTGFKILMDILISSKRPLKIEEFPIDFGTRLHGQSKLDVSVAWEFIMVLVHQLTYRLIPISMTSFFAIGFLGVIIHFALFFLFFELFTVQFAFSQALAALCTMIINFVLNNKLTFKSLATDKSLSRLILFIFICCVGVAINVLVSSNVFEFTQTTLLSVSLGILVAGLWNYFISRLLIWSK